MESLPEYRLLLLVASSLGAIMIGLLYPLHRMLGYHLPAQMVRGAVSFAEKRLNRQHRSVADRRSRGRLIVMVFTALSLVISGAVWWASVWMPWGWYLELASLIYLLPYTTCLSPILIARKALQRKDYSAMARALQRISANDLEQADGHMYIRVAITYLARALPRYVIAPSLWYLLAGLPGLFLCRLLSFMSDMMPASHPHYRAFSAAAHFWDRMMQAIPVRLAMPLLWIGLIFVPRASLGKALQAFSTPKAAEAPSNTRTLPLRLAAYGLHISLGGTRMVGGISRPDPWIGDGKARLDKSDLSRCLLWVVCSIGLYFTVISGCYLAVASY